MSLGAGGQGGGPGDTGGDAGRPGGGAPTPPAEERRDDEGPVGPFPSWRWLYGTVLVWFVVVVAALYLFTVALDFGGP